MRIVFASWRDLAHPQAGGSEVLVDRLARECTALGHETALICGGPVGERPYEVHSLGGECSQYLRAPLTYARRFRKWDLLVDVENGMPFFSPLWRRRPVLCLVHHLHTDQWPLRFPKPVAAAGAAIERRGVPRVYRNSLFMAVSDSTAEAFAEIGVERDRIRVVPNGVDPPPPAVWDQPKEERLFVALGRLVPHKRIDLLLRVWERVRPLVGGRLAILGDGPERERLQRMAGDGVYMPGRVSEEERWNLLRRASLFVHPAMHEGWGIVVMEAAATGTPTLGFRVPGVRDAVLDGETGVLASSEADFARRWIELAEDPQRLHALGVAAQRRSLRYSWRDSAERFLELAEEAVHGRVAAPAGWDGRMPIPATRGHAA
jgi:glycosyltransferase involved in cell wall biosynthesis